MKDLVQWLRWGDKKRHFCDFLLSEPAELPILVASGFCARAEVQLSEGCNRKLEMRENSFLRQLREVVWEKITDVPFQLLVDLITEAYDVLPVLLSVR